LGNGNPEAGLINEVGVGLIDDLFGKVEAGAHFFEPGLFLKPVLVTTGVPPADVVFVQVVAALGKFLDDFGVGSAITEHEIEELAVLTGEPRDLTSSPPTGRAGVRIRRVGMSQWGFLGSLHLRVGFEDWR